MGERRAVNRVLDVLDDPCDDRFFGEAASALHQLVGADEVHVVPFESFRGAPPYLVAFTHERRYHEPLLAAAGARMQHGGYIDTDIFTPAQRECMPMYVEQLAPLGLRSQLVYLLRFRGQTVGVVHANRHGVRGPRFLPASLTRMRTVASVLGAALVARRHQTPALAALLSPREADVATLAARGYENAQIAAHLGTSANTVRNQLHAVFRKLGVYSRLELAHALLGTPAAAVDPTVLASRAVLRSFRLT